MSLPKVEDAFEVWLCRKYPGVRGPRGALVEGLEDDVKAAFLAGAEYGRGEVAVLGDAATSPVGEKPYAGHGICGLIGGDPKCGCVFDFMHESPHSWELTVGIWDNRNNGGRFANPDMTHSTEGYARPKSPLGIMPERFWKEARCRELAAAINRYMQAGVDPATDDDIDPVGGWIHELEALWESL